MKWPVQKCNEDCPGDDTCEHAAVCACGSYMEHHSMYDGHSPVSMHHYYCKPVENRGTVMKWNWTLIFALAFNFAVWAAILYPAFAHDEDHEHDEWYAGLMQPDNPTASCCGLADAYWCDGIHVRNGKTFCVITDDRVVPGRPPIPVGTEVEIPDRKLKWDKSNPTGHAVVFLSSGGAVYCFVQGTGI